MKIVFNKISSMTHLRAKIAFTIVTATALVGAVQCKQTTCKGAECGGSGLSPEAQALLLRQQVVKNYAAMAEAIYKDALRDGAALKSAIESFTAAPSEAGFLNAQQAWRVSRPAYMQSEVFRSYGGPIDNDAPNLPEAQKGIEARVNSWPLDEAFIDDVQQGEQRLQGGIINLPAQFPVIDRALLMSLNQADSAQNVSLGYHALEFLLWGQDFEANSPGRRPYTDYVSGPGGTAQNQERRRQYLQVTAALLVDDLTSVHDAWIPDRPGYAQTFVTQNVNDALTQILGGINFLSDRELTHERLQVAYDNRDREDEHSCFSDDTLEDLFNNALGIENIYEGHYQAVSGPGLSALVAAKDPALDEQIRYHLRALKQALRDIPYPFETAILGADGTVGRQKVKAAIDQAKLLANDWPRVAQVVGVQLQVGQ